MSATAAHRPVATPPRLWRPPRALVLRAPGTNCDRETALALELAGAQPERIHLDAVLAGERSLAEFALLVFPGGFSFGDHLGAGTLWAHKLDALREPLDRFVASGRPVLGICNGFQALLKLGLLRGGALGPNANGRFECRWVWLRRPQAAATPLLAGIERIALPIAHGEGRFVAEHPPALDDLQRRGNVALVYDGADDGAGDGLADRPASPPYPANPNGSAGAVAALANVGGNVLGLMPHPERNVLPGQAPAGRPDGAGLAIFRNAVAMARG
ncbi:MAG: Phosphoribosylformylglycinamidine synthase, glutamine amidotransferase subunit [uncultured Thermomicrobiales bacterium]|uniref:Phosphoribosylformylglycinamidine synthase, glutamine amidotransferase subunit n=1 Tax=uncultured Thermomicrobiales bacterium TaxID=1645740 RepID=A0A6J4UXY1_9BACT|nr:MAG: Phosphoribosylformylglycinamidine synthase, glutamine amidotransferase subunit [uncultured Thermomicrobiales bacterium]